MAALAHRDYRLLWFGFAVSNLGTQMQVLGLGWYVVQLANADGTPELAPLYLGLVAATRAIPSVFVGLFAGAISDRMDRRRLLLLSAAGSSAVAAAFAVTVVTGQATLIVVLLLNTLAAVAFSFEPVTRMAMVPRLVPQATIASAIGLMMMTQTTATLVGPLLGGVLIGPLGVAGLMALNALTFAPVILAMLAIRPMPSTVRTSGALLSGVADGLVYLWRHPILRVQFLLTAVVGLAGRPYQPLLPAFAEDVLGVGPIGLSWLLAAAGAGSIVGSLIVATMGSSPSRGRLFAASAAATGALTLVFSAQQELFWALVTIAVLSIASSAQIGLHVSTYQAAAPDNVRGRVTAVSASMVQSSSAIGALVVGALGSLIGLNLALAAGGVIVLYAGLAGLRSAALRSTTSDIAPMRL